MQSLNVVTRSNANVVACSPSNLVGQQAFTIKDFTCEECSKSKSTVKRPFNTGPIADESITLPGQLIHSDIAGPEQAYNNRNYTINLVDEISGLVNIQFMKNKNEVPTMIKDGIK